MENKPKNNTEYKTLDPVLFNEIREAGRRAAREEIFAQAKSFGHTINNKTDTGVATINNYNICSAVDAGITEAVSFIDPEKFERAKKEYSERIKRRALIVCGVLVLVGALLQSIMVPAVEWLQHL